MVSLRFDCVYGERAKLFGVGEAAFVTSSDAILSKFNREVTLYSKKLLLPSFGFVLVWLMATGPLCTVGYTCFFMFTTT